MPRQPWQEQQGLKLYVNQVENVKLMEMATYKIQSPLREDSNPFA